MEEKVLEIVQSVIGRDLINSSGLIDSEVISSWELIMIVSKLMDAFGIDIDALDITPENFNSVEAICELIRNKGGV